MMADQDTPNQTANKSKAEGERATVQENTAGRSDPDANPERQYPDHDTDNAGGITNRPLSEEVDNQQSLPERGTNRDETRNPGARRPEGDYEGRQE